MRLRQNRSGFALIELMVVVAVLSLAASFFVPRFLKHRIRKHQEECERNLRSFHEAQKAYRAVKGVFAADTAALGWTPQGKPRYDYRFVRSGKNGFVFECSGNIDKDPTLDEASIDETGKITQTSDDLKK
jgi:prepilin-type N-terminal cleavage/methylation domain-containing protein